MTTGAVFCIFPIERSGVLNSHNHEKRNLFTDIFIERRKDMIGDRNCSFIQPLAPSFLAASPVRRMVCDKMRLSRRIAEGEGSEAYDMMKDTHHPIPSDRVNVSTRQIRQGNPAVTDTSH